MEKQQTEWGRDTIFNTMMANGYAKEYLLEQEKIAWALVDGGKSPNGTHSDVVCELYWVFYKDLTKAK